MYANTTYTVKKTDQQPLQDRWALQPQAVALAALLYALLQHGAGARSCKVTIVTFRLKVTS